MPDVTRRGFLAGVSVATGVGIAGGLGLHNALLGAGAAHLPTVAAQAPAPSVDGVTLAGPMLIHVRDLATAEIAMMVGTQELVYRDPELVSRLVRAAASAGRAEG
jgi:hypothetical protein